MDARVRELPLRDFSRYVDARPEDGVLRIHLDLFRDTELFELEMRYIAEGRMTLHSAFRVDYFHQKKTGAFFGHYEHRLVTDSEAWRIAGKRITLMNDFIPTVLDLYHV